MNQLGKPHGAIGVSPFHGITSPAYFIAEVLPSAYPAYVHHLLRSRLFIHEYQRRGKNQPPNQFDISWDQFRDIDVTLPPMAEQRAIADYLDAETARIDALVAKKQQLIHLLDERWRAEVAHRVGGNWAADSILDRSGDETPAGWQVRKLLHLLDPAIPLVYGILLPGPRLDEGVPYIGAGDVRPDRLSLTHLPRTTPEIAAEYPRSRMRPGELVYAIRGSFGAVEQIPTELAGANLSRDAARIAAAEEVCPRYLLWALRSELSQEQFRRHEVGAMVTGVNIGDLKQVKIPIPELPHQRLIAKALDSDWELQQRAEHNLAAQLDLLAERRQALITAAVTGEFKVPGAA